MTRSDDLLADYLARFEHATRDLPPDVRAELATDIRAHLAEIRTAAGSERDIREALDHLGPPEGIAAAAEESTDPSVRERVAVLAGTGTSRGFDIAAVVLVLVGAFVIPGIGWLLGIVLLWSSSSWRVGEKLLATLVWPGGLAAPALVGLLAGRSSTCVTLSEVGPGGTTVVSTNCVPTPLWQRLATVALLVAVALAPIVVAVVLLRRADARRRQATTSAVPVPGGSASTSNSGTRVLLVVVAVLVVGALTAFGLALAGAVAWMRV